METSDKGILRDNMPEQIVDLVTSSKVKESLRDSCIFASYFAGLFEGDGYIYIPRKERTDKGEK